ncbi:MAG: hypothetical protein JNK85_23790 [Verrucomicrobiales bacterium]|nr:hypothetical protein [Verrucomicrobiales bacterium]
MRTCLQCLCPVAATLLATAPFQTAAALAGNPIVVAVPARAGAVTGTRQNSDEFIWRLFIQFVSPVGGRDPSRVVFETWASDNDTFSKQPVWPQPDQPKRFQASRLGLAASPDNGIIDVACNPPKVPGLASFPHGDSDELCIAEEVRRNRPMFDYIVGNQLNTRAGLAAAYARSFDVQMPTNAVAVKGDWIPVQTLLKWIPQIGSLDNLRTLYHTGTSGGVEYGLVSLHVSSRQNTNWVWGTFEHELTPGRCDDIGCCDSFGATRKTVRPNNKQINSQYGRCHKTAKLKAMMKSAGISPVWDHYCLKSTQVDYMDPSGLPSVLGNSVIERLAGNGTVAASSCITCHSYASFDASGTTSSNVVGILPYNPTGRPIPDIMKGSLRFDFMWGVLGAP